MTAVESVMSNFTRFEPSDLKPTDEQRKIQLSPARTILVEAHAGAAKTTTLAIKTGEALSRGLDPEKILILTFTEAARAVMAEPLIERKQNYSKDHRYHKTKIFINGIIIHPKTEHYS